MNFKIKLNGILILLLVLQSCNSFENIEELQIKGIPETKIDLLKNDTSDLKEFSNFFTTPQIIPLNSNDTSFFVASIQKLIVHKNEMYILDDRFSNLVKFDSSGHYIINYGKIGLGKNEYEKISDFDIDSINKLVVVFSNANKALYYYSLDNGAFVKKVNIKLFGSQICALPDKQTLLYRNFSTEGYSKEKDFNILLLDSQGRSVKKAFPFNSDISLMEWRSSGFLRKSNRSIFYCNAFSDTVYEFKNNLFSPVMETNILSDSLKLFRYDHNKLFHSKILMDSNTRHLGPTYLKNDNFVVFDYVRDKRIRTIFYDLNRNTYTGMTAKIKTDPLLALALTPLYLSSDNTIYFKFTLKDLLHVKSKYATTFDMLSAANKKYLINNREKSGVFLLVCHLKNK